MSTSSLKDSLTSLYSAKNIEIGRAEAGYLYCDWIGYQNKESIMKTGDVILDLVKKNKVTHVLNDNTRVSGPWQEASQWTADVWFPNMFQAGLQKFAWVLSPNIFAELSAKQAMPNTESVKAFGNLEEARNWLVA